MREIKDSRPHGRSVAQWDATQTAAGEPPMIVTIVTFNLPQPATLAEITKTFQGTAPKYRGIPGLLRKNYFMSEDGRRAGGIYVWASRADAERVYTAEWRAFVEGKYGTPPSIEYLHSPVMVDNSAGTISVAAEPRAVSLPLRGLLLAFRRHLRGLGERAGEIGAEQLGAEAHRGVDLRLAECALGRRRGAQPVDQRPACRCRNSSADRNGPAGSPR